MKKEKIFQKSLDTWKLNQILALLKFTSELFYSSILLLETIKILFHFHEWLSFDILLFFLFFLQSFMEISSSLLIFQYLLKILFVHNIFLVFIFCWNTAKITNLWWSTWALSYSKLNIGIYLDCTSFKWKVWIKVFSLLPDNVTFKKVNHLKLVYGNFKFVGVLCQHSLQFYKHIKIKRLKVCWYKTEKFYCIMSSLDLFNVHSYID